MDDSYNKLLYELLFFICGFGCGFGSGSGCTCFNGLCCFFTFTISTSSAPSESLDDAS